MSGSKRRRNNDMTHDEMTAYLNARLAYELLMLCYAYRKISDPSPQPQLDWNAY